MKPILFNTQMVREIQKGHKTVTRRIAFRQTNIYSFHSKEYPDGWWFLGRVYRNWDDMLREPQGVLSYAKYKAGDILYVRETWAEMPYGIVYRADDDFPEGWDIDDRWRPSIHMKKEVARIFLRVKEVRLEQLNSMEEEDAIAEGFPELGVDADSPLTRFSDLWDKTLTKKDIGKYDWESNPWVYVYEFEIISKEEAESECPPK